MSTVVSGGADMGQLEALAAATAEFDWYFLLHLGRSIELLDVAERLVKVGRPFVLDHMARITADEGVSSPAFRMLLELLDTDICWVKLASLYRRSSQLYQHEDMMPMIEAVVRARPNRLIWGTNWPHPICHVAMPNDGDLVDLVPKWLPDAELQQQVLVDNPALLYDFDQQESRRGMP